MDPDVLRSLKGSMGEKKLLIGIIVLSILILTGGAYFLGKSNKPSSSTVLSSIGTESKGNPKVETKEMSFDLGKMKVSDERYHDFSISNKGAGPLQLYGIRSSCMCTAGKIIYKGNESEEYGMHAGGAFLTDIQPGTDATVRVTYRPYQMPVYGPIERELYVTTNDPINQQLIFKITANVQ